LLFIITQRFGMIQLNADEVEVGYHLLMNRNSSSDDFGSSKCARVNEPDSDQADACLHSVLDNVIVGSDLIYLLLLRHLLDCDIVVMEDVVK